MDPPFRLSEFRCPAVQPLSRRRARSASTPRQALATATRPSQSPSSSASSRAFMVRRVQDIYVRPREWSRMLGHEDIGEGLPRISIHRVETAATTIDRRYPSRAAGQSSAARLVGHSETVVGGQRAPAQPPFQERPQLRSKPSRYADSTRQLRLEPVGGFKRVLSHSSPVLGLFRYRSPAASDGRVSAEADGLPHAARPEFRRPHVLKPGRPVAASLQRQRRVGAKIASDTPQQQDVNWPRSGHHLGIVGDRVKSPARPEGWPAAA